MRDFNLLPSPQKVNSSCPVLYWATGCGLVFMSLLFGMHLWLCQQKEDLNAQLASINESISHVKDQSVLLENQGSTTYQSFIDITNGVFNSVAKIKNFAICLTAIQLNKREVHLFGNTKSADELTQLLPQLSYPRFAIMQLRTGKTPTLAFELQASLPDLDLATQKKRHAN